ncbi:MAG: folate-binding protein YgfZ [Rhodospirillales bacterium]|nr:folate-binding protein YgfZ [Rhodospirillales bacterium]
MAEGTYTVLEDRGLIGISGEEARDFLQGLISNDTMKTGPDQAIYAAFLTPQGKFLHDFFIIELDGSLLLDCEGDRLADLLKRLRMYKLRAQVDVEDRSPDFSVAALFGKDALSAAGLPEKPGSAAAFNGGVVFADPRLAAAGARAILPKDSAEAALTATSLSPGDKDAYEAVRISLGLPDGSRDMQTDKAILLENGFEELNGVDWDKGCYMGQELTARTKYRGLVKKRLMPVSVDGPLPQPGTPILLDGREAGEMRSGNDGLGLALMRLEALEKAAESGGAFTAGEATLTPSKPDWVDF